jgi:hypothetical protein
MWAFTTVLVLVKIIIIPASTLNKGVLHFLLIGDWGKGGNTGYISNNGVNNHDDDENNMKYNRLEQGEKQRGRQNRELATQNTATNQAAIAEAMGSYSDSFMPSFVIALGDNFYTNGVSSSTDSYWDYLWVNVYLDYYPSLCIPWYPVFGKSIV